MNLIKYISGSTIEGFPVDQLIDVLRHSHSSVSIKASGPGLVVLTDNTILKCVSNYYTSEVSRPVPKSRSAANMCFDTQKRLGVSRSVGTDCKSCHYECAFRSAFSKYDEYRLVVK